MSLSVGDGQILDALLRYRCLTSGQLAKLLGRSPQVVRRAIRLRLRPEFVTCLQRNAAEEAAYALSDKGIAFLARAVGCTVADLPGSWNVTPKRGYFWKHTELVTTIRIAFDLATSDPASLCQIDRTIPEWEVCPRSRRNAPHHQRFVLSDRLLGPDGIEHSHRPDCAFLVHARATGPLQLVAAFLEADRNTESIIRRIDQKLEAYWLYWQQRRFVDAFDAVAMRVLFVLDDVSERKRIHSMQEALARVGKAKGDPVAANAFARIFRFARKSDLDETTILAKPIWYDADDKPRLFFQPVDRAQRSAAAAPEVSP